MFFGIFGAKKEVYKIKEETKKSFEFVKKDISAVTGWIKHLDSEKNLHKKELNEIRDILSSIDIEIEGLKNIIPMMNSVNTKQVFKTNRMLFKKQTPVEVVQTGVQTGVQTPKLDQFSVTERAILWILLNTDMKLSYDDLASMLGKERSTIRGQINRIKQKDESLVEEVIEKNGKKRVFIPEEIREKMMKKAKVSVRPDKKAQKNTKRAEQEA